MFRNGDVKFFTTRHGSRLAADVWGLDEQQPVLLLHGGGQNRYSWGETARVIASKGFQAIALDLRGHGESDYAMDGDYRIDSFADDIVSVIGDLHSPPVLVGASLGGIISLIAAGERRAPVKSLILVDVAFRAAVEGADRILSFMRKYKNGFDSMEQAAKAISIYLPHRNRSAEKAGKSRNFDKYLRRKNDGRYYWHWDPRFLDTVKVEELMDTQRLIKAARFIKAPLLLLRGMLSDVVTEDIAKELVEILPHAKSITIPGAAHTVPGDSNFIFTEYIVAFLGGKSPLDP